MSNSDFLVLTELYRFLSQFKPEAIAAAAQRGAISDNLRVALGALAREARDNGRGNSRLRVASTRKGGRSIGGKLSADLSVREYRTNLKNFLLDERKFPDKMTLAQFAHTVGVPEAANAKYSRERVAHRIVQRALKDELVRKRLYELVTSHDTGNAQTRGWMDLILRER